MDNDKYRGNEKYFPPYGFFGLGLNVCGKYEENGEWLLKKDSNWAVAYFGINSENKNKDIKNIIHNICLNNDVWKYLKKKLILKIKDIGKTNLKKEYMLIIKLKMLKKMRV